MLHHAELGVSLGFFDGFAQELSIARHGGHWLVVRGAQNGWTPQLTANKRQAPVSLSEFYSAFARGNSICQLKRAKFAFCRPEERVAKTVPREP
jgi:hypothetical protein